MSRSLTFFNSYFILLFSNFLIIFNVNCMKDVEIYETLLCMNVLTVAEKKALIDNYLQKNKKHISKDDKHILNFLNEKWLDTFNNNVKINICVPHLELNEKQQWEPTTLFKQA